MHSRLSLRVLGLAALGLVVMSAASRADQTVFNNFGPGNSYFDDLGETVSGPNVSSGSFTPAQEFDPSASGKLTTIDIALSFFSGANTGNVFLADDNGGKPGTILESWTVNNLPAFGPPNDHSPTLLSSTLNLQLTAGTHYWLYATASNANILVWNVNSIRELGVTDLSTNGGSTWTSFSNNTQGAFRVSVSSVPEASSLFGMGSLLAVGGLAALRRRARK